VKNGDRLLQKNGDRLLQHPSAFSRGIYPSVSGSEMSGSDEMFRHRHQGINPQAESQSSLKAAIFNE